MISKRPQPRHPSEVGFIEEAPSWYEEAWAAVKRLARSGEDFTSDDLIEAVGVPDEGHGANAANSAVGPVFARASRAGLIECVGVTKSKQASRKGGMVRTWRGL